MPTLDWIGKDKVINHHLDVPYRVLKKQYTFNAEQSENKIIHGDNLEALKSLLPEYEGRIKCIYIDPPYNTGNEGWVYNDNVNHPKIKKWLGEVVGKEGEDLTRHDKWLCMMYPRLKLLHKLLADDGVIFVSIDENEYNYLSLLMEDIFGRQNKISTLIWKKSYGGGAKSKYVVNLHEYIFFYAKNLENVPSLSLPPDNGVLKYYKYKDSKYKERGPYRLQPLATTSMDDRPNLQYPIEYNNEKIFPNKQWQWSKKRVEKALANDEIVIEKKNGNWSVNYKQYLKSENGEVRGKKLYSIISDIYTQHGTYEVRKIFSGKAFEFPKPLELIKTFVQLVTSKEDIVLDSFAGSGPSAHAVLELNKEDGSNRKFILIEMEEYAENITAERIRRVIDGYDDTEGTGGDFTYYKLGEPIFKSDDSLNEELPLEDIRRYIYFTETGTTEGYEAHPEGNPYHLGSKDGAGYYFYYETEQATILDYHFLASIRQKAEQYVIYADTCGLSEAFLNSHNILFKKIPRDISRI